MYICTYTHIDILVHIHTYIYIYIHTYVHSTYILTYIYTYIRTYVRTNIRISIHTYIQTSGGTWPTTNKDLVPKYEYLHAFTRFIKLVDFYTL